MLVILACSLILLAIWILSGSGQKVDAVDPDNDNGPLPPVLFSPIVVSTPRPGPVGSPANISRLTEKSAEQSVPSVPPTRTGVHEAPSPTVVASNTPSGVTTVGVLVAGTVSWYPASGMVAAAHSWQWGDTPYPVRVCSGPVCITVTVQDYCQGCTHGRLLDLSDDAFRHLAPLSQGLVRVTTYGWR